LSKLDAAIEGMTIFEAVERVRAAILREPHLSFLESTVPASIRRLDDRALAIIVPILEAAAKIHDKTMALCVLNDLSEENRVPDDWRKQVANELRALLESLPDEPTLGPGKEK
jgi:hypothetical protein